MRKLSMSELERPTADEYAQQPKLPIVLVVDNVRSMHNVGAFFRTADALGIEGIYLCGITAQPPHREIYKAALGAEETVRWQYFATTVEALTELRQQGYAIWLLEQMDKSVPLTGFRPQQKKLALVVGNEVNGVSEEAIPLADGALEIRQVGTKHSLNVSVATGIALWHLCTTLQAQ